MLDSFLSRTQILLIQLMQDPKSIIEQGMAEYSGIFGSGTDSIIYGNSIYYPKCTIVWIISVTAALLARSLSSIPFEHPQVIPREFTSEKPLSSKKLHQ